ncbi:hypothetical protein M408DRAFT_12889 [Serendipita vermifera MAFF 305830]|uniref:Uncharacterized protein n=1 Tax=Serendipita vermifera MAFF 305830 TaxID=933852 RepID=A0A0C2WTD1_SERVB|nr:hypothetical protein M408DRAFT_12889 [Serendipita vermifera MAFF 305830]
MHWWYSAYTESRRAQYGRWWQPLTRLHCPFAQVSFGSEAQLDLEDALAGWSTPGGVCKEGQPSAAPSDISPWMFLAPEAEAQEESTGPGAEAPEELVALEPEAREESARPEAEDQEEPVAHEPDAQEELVAPEPEEQEEPAAPAVLVAEVEIQPAVASSSASSATQSRSTRQIATTSQQPASTAPTSGQLARIREVPSAYLNTEKVDVETLLSQEITTTVALTPEEETTFLEHLRNGNDVAAMEMLPEEQRFCVLDTPEEIAAYRAVRRAPHSLRNREDRIWVCRAIIKVKLSSKGKIIGLVRMNKHCKNAVGSNDSVTRHWRRTHLKLEDVEKASVTLPASGSN